jgi:hypothetical protein
VRNPYRYERLKGSDVKADMALTPAKATGIRDYRKD